MTQKFLFEEVNLQLRSAYRKEAHKLWSSGNQDFESANKIKHDHYHIHKDVEKDQKPSALENYPKKIDLNENMQKPKTHKHGNGSSHSH